MKLKTLFLGTAAAFAVSGGAQAADLAIAVEPVDYVKVCDAFGTGYYYIPGTDTCLKIAGQIRLDVVGYQDVNMYFPGALITGQTASVSISGNGSMSGTLSGDPASSFVSGTVSGSVSGGGSGKVGYGFDGNYDPSWMVRTRIGLNFTAQTMSDLGPIVTYMAFQLESNNADWNGSTTNEDWLLRSDGMYGAIGPVLFGWTASTFDPGGGYNYYGDQRSDKKTDQLRFSYMMGTWGIMLGLEDPRDRWGSAATGSMPDIILALTGSAGPIKIGAAVGVVDLTYGTGWGVQANAVWDFGGGSKLKGVIAYADNAGNFTATPNTPGTSWGGFLSGILMLSSNLGLYGTVAYNDAANGQEQWAAAFGPHWFPTATSEIGIEANYAYRSGGTNVPLDSWGVYARFKTIFNGG